MNAVYEDDIKLLEAWPVAGDMDLDYSLVSRIHRAIIDPFMPDAYRIRALARLGHIIDKPTRICWQDVQVYMRNCINES